jgi:site-specific DNA-methyltransferase (adenine-specific)
MDINKIHNQDCLEAMKLMQDNEFDLAIVDPPYGIDMDGGNIGGNNLTKAKDYTKKDWDKSAPSREYFNELKRINKNVIIFGANHFIENIPNSNSSCWIVWDKDNSGNFADCELAYTSFKSAVRKYKFRWNGMLQGDMKNKEQRIHPTQKPVKLYEWLLMNYAKEGDKILDTHLGSGSIAIACHNLGYDLTGYELDKEYYDNAIKRIKNHQAQTRIF